MRKMALSGSVSYSGAKSCRARFNASTSWRIGSLTFSSKSGLRGKNHSRVLLRARPRKNCRASGGKPGKGDGTVSSVCELSHISETRGFAAQFRRSEKNGMGLPGKNRDASTAKDLHYNERCRAKARRYT